MGQCFVPRVEGRRMADREGDDEAGGWHGLLRRVLHPTPQDYWPLVGSIVAVVTVLIAALTLVVQYSALPAKAPPSVSGTIASLKDGQELEVDQLRQDPIKGARLEVSGSVINLGSETPYCVVRAEDGNYYPTEAVVSGEAWNAEIGLGKVLLVPLKPLWSSWS